MGSFIIVLILIVSLQELRKALSIRPIHGIVLLIWLAILLIFVHQFWPGIAMDIGHSWLILESSNYDIFKGVIFGTIARTCLVGLNSPGIILLLQTLLALSLVTMIIYHFEQTRNGKIKFILASIILLFLFSPYFFIQLISLDRTILFGLILAVSLIRIHDHIEYGGRTTSFKNFTLTLLLLTFGLAMRPEGLLLSFLFIFLILIPKRHFFSKSHLIIAVHVVNFLVVWTWSIAESSFRYVAINSSWYAYTLMKSPESDLTESQKLALENLVSRDVLEKLSSPIKLSKLWISKGINISLEKDSWNHISKSITLSVLTNPAIILKEKILLWSQSFELNNGNIVFWESNPKNQDGHGSFLSTKGAYGDFAKRNQNSMTVYDFMNRMPMPLRLILNPTLLTFLITFFFALKFNNSYWRYWIFLFSIHLTVLILAIDTLLIYFWPSLLTTMTMLILVLEKSSEIKKDARPTMI
jgi:hypothetical protein